MESIGFWAFVMFTNQAYRDIAGKKQKKKMENAEGINKISTESKTKRNGIYH